jgi:hypothetical protein
MTIEQVRDTIQTAVIKILDATHEESEPKLNFLLLIWDGHESLIPCGRGDSETARQAALYFAIHGPINKSFVNKEDFDAN